MEVDEVEAERALSGGESVGRPSTRVSATPNAARPTRKSRYPFVRHRTGGRGLEHMRSVLGT
eukprot:12123229-Prorocentrum_lima.AAC.1